MPEEEQGITNGERSYFATIPHIADDDLNLYEYRLYGHYRRICGEHYRRCVEKTVTTAEKLGISKASVINTRRSLETKGYIRIEYERQHNYERVFIHLEDIWPQNMQRYAKSYPQETVPPVTSETGTGHVGNRHGSRRKPPPVTSGTAYKEEYVKEEPDKEEPVKEEDDADLRSHIHPKSSSKNGSTRDHACKIVGSPTDKSPAAKHDAIRTLLTSWLPEITGYGGWDNWQDYLHAVPDYQLYDLAEWFYRFIARPTWAAKIGNPSGFIQTMMDMPGKRSPGTSPAERLALHSYIHEADSLIRHLQETV